MPDGDILSKYAPAYRTREPVGLPNTTEYLKLTNSQSAAEAFDEGAALFEVSQRSPKDVLGGYSTSYLNNSPSSNPIDVYEVRPREPADDFEPSEKLCWQVMKGTQEYWRQLREYAEFAFLDYGEHEEARKEEQGVPVLDMEGAAKAIKATVQVLVHIFPAGFPDIDAPKPFRLTEHRRFTHPVREFIRSRLVAHNEEEFFTMLVDELFAVAPWEIVRSGRGILTTYQDELALRISRRQPLGPRAKFIPPDGWVPAG